MGDGLQSQDGCAGNLVLVDKPEPVVQYRCGLWLKGRGEGRGLWACFGSGLHYPFLPL